MNIFKNKTAIALFGLFALTSIISCDKVEDSDSGGTTTQQFAGEWFVIGFAPDDTQLTDYITYTTYNAASNDQNFWIDDHNVTGGFHLKTKVQALDYNNLTFAGQVNEKEIYTGDGVTVSHGKILKNAAHSFGHHVVDSIYFEAEFKSEPGVIYKFKGHKRTGFKEDEL